MQPMSTNEFDWERWASQDTDVITNVLHRLAWHLTTERMPIVKEGHHGWQFSVISFNCPPEPTVEYIPLPAPEKAHWAAALIAGNILYRAVRQELLRDLTVE